MKKWKLGALALIFFLLLVAVFSVTLVSDDSQDGQNTNNVSVLAASSSDLTFTPNSSSSPTYYTVSAANTSMSGNLVIPETYNSLPVKSIASNAFYGCTDLTSVTIPYSITSIGTSAFANCTSLEYVYYNATSCNSTSYSVDNSAWKNAGADVQGGLKAVIGNNVTSVPNYAFYGANNLTSLTISPSVTSIGSSIIYGCDKLQDVYFNALALTSTNSSFSHSATIYDAGVNLHIGADVTKIPTYLFSGFNTLGTVYYNSSSIVGISYTADNTAWKNAGSAIEGGAKLIIGDNVTTLASSAFAYFSNLSSVQFNAELEIIKASAFAHCTSLVDIVLPDSVVTLESSAFYDCSALENITIGKGLKSLNNTSFANCPLLKNVYYNSTAGDSYSYSSTNFPFYQSATEGFKLIFGEDVTSIPDYKFRFSNVSSIEFSPNLKTIGYNSFDSCVMLESISLPENLESIGSSAFTSCTSLKTIEYNVRLLLDLNSSIFSGSESGVTVIISDSVNYIPNSLFNFSTLAVVHYNASSVSLHPYTANTSPWKNAGSAIENGVSLIIGDNVKEIQGYAFYNFNNLKSVTIGPEVERIKSNAFAVCTSLVDVSVAKNTVIESNAFDDNIQLSYVDTVTVHFNSNGGSELKDKYLLTGNKLTKPEDPVRDGYNFAGLYTNLALTKEYNFDNPVTENITLYANWSNVNDDPVTDDPINNEKETNYTWILWVIVILIALYLIFGGRK